MKITIRLRPDRDDDIRDWYQSLPHGDRSRVIRNVLKEFINHKKDIGQDSTIRKRFANKELVKIDLKPDKSLDTKGVNIDRRLDTLLDQI